MQHWIDSITPLSYCLVVGPWVAVAFVWSAVRGRA